MVTVTLLGYVVIAAGVDRILETLRLADPTIILLAVGIDIFGVVISAKKWNLLLDAKDESIPFSQALRLYYVGAFYNIALPTTVGGDAIRSVQLSRQTDDPTEAYASVFVERFSGLVALLLFAIGAAISHPAALNDRLWFGLVVVIGGTIVVTVIVFFEHGRNIIYSTNNARLSKFKQKIRDISQGIKSYRNHIRTLWMVFMLSVLFQMTPIVNHYLLSRSLGLQLPLEVFFVLVPVSSVLLLLPISIQGYGLREALYVFFLTGSGISLHGAVVFSFLIQIVALIRNGLGGLWVLSDGMN